MAIKLTGLLNPELPPKREDAAIYISSCCLLMLLGPLLIVAALAWEAFVLSYLWEWFVSPALNVPTLSVHYAFGFVLLVTLLENATAKQFSQWSADVVIRSAFVLLVGLLVHYYV